MKKIVISFALATVLNASAVQQKNIVEAIFRKLEPIERLSQETVAKVCNIQDNSIAILEIVGDLGECCSITGAINSQLDVVESKIDALPDCCSTVAAIDSKLDVVESKIDALPNCCSTVAAINSKLDVVESKIDALSCAVTITNADIPYTITQPGLYCVIEDITYNSMVNQIITINVTGSGGVDLNLNGHIISAAGSDATAVQIDDGFDIVVHDGILSTAGIIIEGGSHITLTNINQGNYAFAGGNGLFIVPNAHDILIDNCQFNANNAAGLRIDDDVSNVVVRNSLFFSNGTDGVQLNDTGGTAGKPNGISFQGCQFFKNSDNGLLIDGATNVTVIGCGFNRNTSDGLEITSKNNPVNVQINHNTFLGNSAYGINNANAATLAIFLNTASFNTSGNYTAGVITRNPNTPDALFGNSKDLVSNIGT